MIQFFLLLSILTAAYLPFRSRIFELSAATLLIVPVEAFLLGQAVPLTTVSYGALLLLNVGVVYYIIPQEEDSFSIWHIAPMLVWGFLFVVCLSLCHRWPDFMPMGERLRDYALLAEVMKYPIHPNEPWMTGFSLNYYLFWYRFGSFLGAFLHFPVWQMYHLLQAVTFSLFITSCFRILNFIGGFNFVYSLLSALVIGFGSNVEGIQYAFTGDHDGFKWWGPSRVVTGCINEFAAWSFLLGDLHPHYLNLTLVPILIVLTYTIWKSELATEKRLLILSAMSVLLFPLWIFNSNAWEVPELGLFFGFMGLLTLYANPIPVVTEAAKRSLNCVTSSLPILGAIILGALSLYLSSRNISPGDDHFKLITPPIKLTATGEMFRHWGVPLTVVAIGVVILLKESTLQILAVSALAGCTHAPIALPFIVFVIIFNIIRVLRIEKSEFTFERILFETMGFVSLSLIFLPEVFFLDDPYGGDSERMNTIFKAYSANWSLFHLFAFWIIIQVVLFAKERFPQLTFKTLPWVQPALWGCAMLPVCFVMCQFFFITVGDRASKNYNLKPIEQGLNDLDATYAGAADTMKQFQALPEGVTLESQGNPYSLTSHVATLGAKRSYLGWMNHVDLLLRKYDESKRRASITEKIYKSTDCSSTQTMMSQEGIRYLVVGPLEKERYPGLNLESYNCLKNVITTPSYTIFQNQ